jgi:hypothetical protein
MTTYIHLLRLRILESEIQHKIYRVDRNKSTASIHRTTDAFLERLSAWKSVIPTQSTQHKEGESTPGDGNDYRSYDSYVSLQSSAFRKPANKNEVLTKTRQMASYYKTMRLLLQPRLYDKPVDPKYLGLCAEACRGLCETYKVLHSKVPISFSSFSLQSVFLAGLTLIYCMWHDTFTSSAFKNFGALSDCSVVLYVMAERWPVGKKYRDLFEAVKKCVLEGLADGNRSGAEAGGRQSTLAIDDGMKSSLGNLQMDTAMDHVSGDLEQMISDMAGQPIAMWQDLEDEGMFDGTGTGDVGGSGKLFGQNTSWDAAIGDGWYSGEFSTALT